MKTTLRSQALASTIEGLSAANHQFQVRFPDESPLRQPIHSVYGGAHLFKSSVSSKLGASALKTLREYAPEPDQLAEVLDEAAVIRVYPRIIEKLEREPVEDFRADFEDGYGYRSDAEEDEHAVQVAIEMAGPGLPPFVGIRVKALTEELSARSLRTLDLFLTALLERRAELPPNFRLTLPKVTVVQQVAAFARVLHELESAMFMKSGLLKFEVMIETAQSLQILEQLREAAEGRCIGAHFGAYDYTATLGITAAHQTLRHSACDFARHRMLTAFASTGVTVSDGGTNVLPIAPHRGENLTDAQRIENRTLVHRAWKLHFDDVQHSLANGFFQGWDLHPAQLVTRYAAVYSYYWRAMDEAGRRLKNFIEQAAQATRVSNVFDDAATGQGLLNFFARAINCGAITPEEAQARTGVSNEEFRAGSFTRILKRRAAN